MIEWEIIKKHRTRIHGRDWEDVPSVAIGKNGLSMNGPLYQRFGNGSRQVLIHAAEDMIGIKFIPEGEYDPDAYSVSKKAQPSKCGTRLCQCKTIPERFPNAVGSAYRATPIEGTPIIAVALTAENRLSA